MEPTRSSPFQRTTKQHTIDTSIGNVPRGRVFRVNPEIVIENVKPIEKNANKRTHQLQEGDNKGKILNVSTHDPQIWNTLIDLQKGIVVIDYIKSYKDTDAETMYKYMKTFLEESAKALWEAYKFNFP